MFIVKLKFYKLYIKCIKGNNYLSKIWSRSLCWKKGYLHPSLSPLLSWNFHFIIHWLPQILIANLPLCQVLQGMGWTKTSSSEIYSLMVHKLNAKKKNSTRRQYIHIIKIIIIKVLWDIKGERADIWVWQSEKASWSGRYVKWVKG